MRRLYFWYRHKKTGYFRFNFRIWHPGGTGGSTVRPGDYERINANPPTPAGTEGPGK